MGHFGTKHTAEVDDFASRRSPTQRSPWIPDDMNRKLDAVYCILVVATAVLVGIVKCTNCGNDKSP